MKKVGGYRVGRKVEIGRQVLVNVWWDEHEVNKVGYDRREKEKKKKKPLGCKWCIDTNS